MGKWIFNSIEFRLLPDRRTAGRLVLRHHAAVMKRRFAYAVRRETTARVRATKGAENVRTYVERYEFAAHLIPTTITFYRYDGSIAREGDAHLEDA